MPLTCVLLICTMTDSLCVTEIISRDRPSPQGVQGMSAKQCKLSSCKLRE